MEQRVGVEPTTYRSLGCSTIKLPPHLTPINLDTQLPTGLRQLGL